MSAIHFVLQRGRKAAERERFAQLQVRTRRLLRWHPWPISGSLPKKMACTFRLLFLFCCQGSVASLPSQPTRSIFTVIFGRLRCLLGCAVSGRRRVAEIRSWGPAVTLGGQTSSFARQQNNNNVHHFYCHPEQSLASTACSRTWFFSTSSWSVWWFLSAEKGVGNQVHPAGSACCLSLQWDEALGVVR